MAFAHGRRFPKTMPMMTKQQVIMGIVKYSRTTGRDLLTAVPQPANTT